MKLYLAQHGEACTKEIDPERPLTEKGKADVERVAQFLQQAGIHIDRVIHSGKLRATQTAEIIAQKIAPETPLETSSAISPNDDPASFHWQSDVDCNDILVVGHLPFMAKLVSHLLIKDAEQVIAAYQPGSLVCLEQFDNQWQLNWMLRPELVI